MEKLKTLNRYAIKITDIINLKLCRNRLLLLLLTIMSQNGHTHFKNLAAFAARFLKCV